MFYQVSLTSSRSTISQYPTSLLLGSSTSILSSHWQKVYQESLARDIQREKNQAAIELLQQWREEGDAEEQKETLSYLMQAIDEDRLSDRKLFP